MSHTKENDDGRDNTRIANYTAFFESSQNDNETQKENRLNNYAAVVNGWLRSYYSLHLRLVNFPRCRLL